MPAATGPFLVVRRDDGYGDVYPLQVGLRFTLGRANTNRIVLKDELCSREHAEVYFAEGHWRLRDLKSLNGTQLNDAPLDGEGELAKGDAFSVGHTTFLFVNLLEELPPLPPPPQGDNMSIKKRLGQTRFLTPLPESPGDGGVAMSKHALSRDLALLYRLALDMGSANSYTELVHVVLDGLLDALTADVGAILTIKEGRELEVTAYRHRDPKIQGLAALPPDLAKEEVTPSQEPNDPGYVRVSEFVTNEVIASKEAVLAEDVSRDRYLRNRESITYMGATSLICAPVVFGDKVLGLIHLYCTDPHKSLTAEDLEFAVAVARQLGAATYQMLRQASLSAENQSLRDQLRVESELVGSSETIQDIHSQIARVADTNATVLIRGESGVGKELVARAIHYSSRRKDAPFVCLNCAALTETLLESELFGHEKGAFTGATEKKIGKFEAANGGTIFLDEIGEMTFSTQAKLLRVLEGHPFERVGGHLPIQVDVRVVAATNQPLEKALQAGTFRRDLFYRLQVVEVQVPPLRDRRTDVPLLANHFLKRFLRETGRKIRGFTPAALKKMQEYHWPGNVRELRNVVERAVALGRGPTLDAADIWLSSLEVGGPFRFTPGYEPISLEEIEKRHILQTLEHTDWNKTQTASILGIERSTLDRKIRTYQLKKEGE